MLLDISVGEKRERKKKKRNYLDTYLIPFTQCNSKWVIDLQIKCKFIEFKLLEIKGVKSRSNCTY